MLNYSQDTINVLQFELLRVKSWDEVLSTLVQIPRPILPAYGLALVAYQFSPDSRSLVAIWKENEETLFDPLNNNRSNGCPCYLDDKENGFWKLRECHDSYDRRNKKLYPRYCLNLWKDNHQALVLYLYFSHMEALTLSGKELLEEVAPFMALTAQNLRLQEEVERLSTSLYKEKHRIATHLHNTIAHSLASLRLKLDEFVYNSDSTQSRLDLDDLTWTRELANECYEQVRSLLSSLVDDEKENIDLVVVLDEFANDLSERTGIAVHTNIDTADDLNSIPNEKKRKIFRIVQEAMRNIEKHAHAAEVIVSVVKQGDSLVIEITDDGNGFDWSQVDNQRGHFGLKMIRNLAEELNGKVSILSAIGSGTRIHLQLSVF